MNKFDLYQRTVLELKENRQDFRILSQTFQSTDFLYRQLLSSAIQSVKIYCKDVLEFLDKYEIDIQRCLDRKIRILIKTDNNSVLDKHIQLCKECLIQISDGDKEYFICIDNNAFIYTFGEKENWLHIHTIANFNEYKTNQRLTEKFYKL